MIKIAKDLRVVDFDGVARNVAHCHHIREAMGIDRGKLPVGSVDGKYIGDTFVYVLSREDAREVDPKVNRPHRMIALCNHCGKHVPTGRFGQHLKIHNLGDSNVLQTDDKRRKRRSGSCNGIK